MTNQIYKNKQSGMAAIMFAMLMVIVITLLSIGFAVLVRNDQRQTLDKTLSNEAQYAAESAVNIKTRYLIANHGLGLDMEQNLTCNTDTRIVGTSVIFPSMPGVEITCLTWDATPSALKYIGVGITSPIVAPLTPAGSAPSDTINSILITWTPSTPGAAVLPPVAPSLNPLTLVNFPSIRITAVADSNIAQAKTIIVNPSASLTIYPIQSGINSGFLPAPNTGANTARAKCNTVANLCAVLLTGLPAGSWTSSGGGRLAISSLGAKSTINVYAYKDSSNIIQGTTPAIAIKNAQYVIDATAKSQDVIRRIVSNVSMTETTWRPGFAAWSDTLCKNYKLDGNNDTAPLAQTSGVTAEETTHLICQ